MASKIIVDQLEKTGGSLTALTLPTSNASASEFLQNNGSGVLSWASASAGFHNVQFITTSANPVTLTSGTTLIIVEVQGAGGASGSSTGVGYVGGTGGSGAYSLQQLTVVDTDTWNVTIGAGGVNGATISGGDTVFATASGSSLGSTITAGGGAGAPDASSIHGDGGVGGTVTNANTGNKLSIAGPAGSAGNSGQRGPGSMFGFGGTKRIYADGDGGNAVGYGSGAGAAAGVSNAGANGSAGLVIMWEYK